MQPSMIEVGFKFAAKHSARFKALRHFVKLVEAIGALQADTLLHEYMRFARFLLSCSVR